uniref:Uncharacterized protein n=1 Tax=Rhizophora mucronata TaxID=61149 RepID=A0A2P2P0S2_RHIMU
MDLEEDIPNVVNICYSKDCTHLRT